MKGAGWPPEYVREWHPTRNDGRSPDETSPSSSIRAWWQCARGHEWQAPVGVRLRQNTKCPYCAGKKAAPESSLLAVNPGLSKEWDYERNGELKPSDLLPSSGKLVWWRCNSGHCWQATPHHRNKGRGCAVCARKKAAPDQNFALEHPALAAEWNPTRNSRHSPSEFRSMSNKRVWWRCAEGHEWQAMIAERVANGNRCPSCRAASRGTIRALFPSLIQEIDTAKQSVDVVSSLSPGSQVKVEWTCAKGHRWIAPVAKRTAGRGCPFCANQRVDSSNSLASLHPDLAAEWDREANGSTTPDDIVPGSGTRAWWRCSRGHKWRTTIASRAVQGTNCPQCNPQTSKTEVRVLSEIAALLAVEHSWRSRIGGWEADISFPSLGIVIEVDGYPWHLGDDAFKRDQVKTKTFQDAGNTVFRLRDARLSPGTGACEVPLREANLLACIQGLAAALVRSCPLLTTAQRHALEGYSGSDRYVADTEYKAIIALLPGPPPEKSLQALYPKIAETWHPTLNHPLRPDKVHARSGHHVWWQCSKGHEWKAPPANRTGGSGCPRCAGLTFTATDGSLAAAYPAVAAEWHPSLNAQLRPTGISAANSRAVWWRCKQGHEWKTSISNRTRQGTRCPFCAGKKPTGTNNFAARYPDIAALFDRKANHPADPAAYLPKSERRVWWHCSLRHTWERPIDKQVRAGPTCPDCSRPSPKPSSPRAGKPAGRSLK